MNIEEWFADRRVQVGTAVAAAVVLLLVLRAVAARRRESAKAASTARRRERLRNGLRALRDDLRAALDGSRPVFAKVASETAHASVVGHWRRSLHHAIRIRVPDMGDLKAVARDLGMDATHLADLDNGLRKSGRTIREYNEGKLDDSPTPIATVKQVEKELERLLVLANLCVQKYGSS